MNEEEELGSEAAPLPAALQGWRVRIMDLSGGAEDGIVEEIGPFQSLLHANEFACRYVRDSLELCRAGGLTGQALLDGWAMFGEDAIVLPESDENWQSAVYIERFAAKKASAKDRNWRALDPRRPNGMVLPEQDSEESGPS